MSARAAVLLLALATGPALADVLLPGEQHLGDGTDPALVPAEPVTRTQMQANPTRFHLSHITTVTAVQWSGVNDLDNQLQVFIDDMSLPRAGSLSGSCDTGGPCTYTLATPLTLAPGPHTIWPDGGCTPAGFTVPCATGENDFAFTGMALISPERSTARSQHRRRHLGVAADADDDYGGRWYPDAGEGTASTLSFSLDVERVLSEIRFFRLRDVATAPPKFAAVQVDGVTVGELTGNGDPFILSTALVVPAGSHSLSVTVGDESPGMVDDVSWDDLVMLFVNNPATTPGAFNAVDVGADAATGALTTRTAGADFSVDIVAISGGAQFSGYAGTVSIELLDASTGTGVPAAGSNCDAGWTSLGALGTATFAASDGGRKTVTLSYADAVAHARLRLSDAALGVIGCSADNFAIRPATFGNIVASHDGPAAPGTAEALASGGFTATTLPIHRAGRPFTVIATAFNAVGAVTPGYTGAPVLAAAGSLLGAATGSAAASGWSGSGGTVRSDAATYSEAGAVGLELSDPSFAAVDADDTPAATRQVGPVSFAAGRFVPDHFKLVELVPARFEAACGSFTYAGQPFFFNATPAARVLAVGADDTTLTTNYDGALYKLPSGGALPAASYAAAAGALDLSAFPNPDNSFVNEGGGVSRYTVVPRSGGYAFLRGAPVLPFTADIGITLTLVDADGVSFAPGAPQGFGQAVAGAGIPFLGSGSSPSQVRFGRLVLEHAHGSERLPLDVPLRAEYWESVGSVGPSGGFVQNLADGCTVLSAADFDLVPGAYTSVTAVTAPNLPGAHLRLAAPNVSGQVTATGDIGTLYPWLRVDANADGSYVEMPAARATFGLFRNDSRRVYQREVVGP